MSDATRRTERLKKTGRSPRGLLRSLLRNEAGNVLAITAAATIPMLGVIGGAIDISRVYMTKSRAQAACDSAVLAGRKAMTTTQYTDAARGRAVSMFNANFQDEDYGTSDTSFTSSANSSGMVSGTVTTNVPMAVMHVFGAGPSQITVTCSADIQVPNIDIVLVLDVTGSMDSRIGGTKKIDSLKAAAKDFYTTLQTAMAGNTTSQIRYGLVPYDEAVNGADVFTTSPNFATLGQLPLSHFVDTMTVQSRVAEYDNDFVSRWVPDPNSTPIVYNQTFRSNDQDTKEPFKSDNPSGTTIRNDDCDRYGQNLSFEIDSSNTKVTLYPKTTWPGEGKGDSELYKADGSNVWQSSQPTSGTGFTKITFNRTSSWFGGWRGGNGDTGTCTREVRHTRYIKEEGYPFEQWIYKPVDYDVSSYKSGGSLTYATSINTNALVAAPGEYSPVQLVGMGVATSTDSTRWNGCIEERPTVAASTFTPIPANAFDLNFIDGGTDAQRRWRPALRDLTYNRGREAWRYGGNYNPPATSCPSARMQNLQVMSQSVFNSHIDSLEPGGNTYLDVGMIWGLRLIAPQGMFAARNLTGPNGGQISRHIIFLTDGEPVSADTRYTAYGVEQMERRITGSTGVAQSTLHSRRFQALCDAQRGAVSIWAIAFGTSVTGNLSNCADPGRAFQANNTTQLRDAFRTIAQQVADLRLVQ